jgi:hypothetical protein
LISPRLVWRVTDMAYDLWLYAPLFNKVVVVNIVS